MQPEILRLMVSEGRLYGIGHTMRIAEPVRINEALAVAAVG